MKNSIAQNNYGIKIRNRINEIVFDNVSFSYDKKMVTTTSTYGTENANYTGGRIEHFHIERGKTEKLNKDGSFNSF